MFIAGNIISRIREFVGRSKYRTGTFVLVAGSVASVFTSVVSGILLPRLLSPSIIGQYGYWLDLFSTLLLLFALGAHGMVIRHFPGVEQGGESGLFYRLARIKVLFFLGTLTVLWWYLPNISLALWLILLGALFGSLAEVLRSFHYMKERFLTYVSYPNLLRVIRLTLVLWLGTRGTEVAITTAVVLPVLLGSPLLIPGISLGYRRNSSGSKPTTQELIKGSFWFWLSGLLLFAMGWSTTLMARWLGIDWDRIGQLTVANRFVVLAIASFCTSYIDATLPELSFLHTWKKQRRAADLFYRSLSNSNFVVVPITLLLWKLSPAVLPLFVGAEYLEAARMVSIMAPMVLFWLWHIALTRLLVINDRIQSLFVIRAVGFAGYVSISLLGLENLGTWGFVNGLLFGYFLFAFLPLFFLSDFISLPQLMKTLRSSLVGGVLMIVVLLIPSYGLIPNLIVAILAVLGYVGTVILIEKKMRI